MPSFLEKIARIDGDNDPVRQVAEMLRDILGSLQGAGTFSGDIGLGDYLERRGNRELVQALMDEIRSDIADFEPRLTETECTLLGRDTDLRLVIQITGLVAGRKRAFQLRLHPVLGMVEVESLPTGE